MDEVNQSNQTSKQASTSPPNLLRKTFPVGPLQCNCTILGDPTTKQATIVDPGGDAEKIFATTKKMGLKITKIIHTHAHLDHILAAGKLHEMTGAALALHKEDQILWDNLEAQCLMFNIPYVPIPSPSHWLEHEENLCCLDGTALHTPGHTPGSMSFWFAKDKLLIAGDTLFRGSIGRTDLWGGDSQKIITSIQALYKLDEDATVITGHGPETNIGKEKKSNPYVKG